MATKEMQQPQASRPKKEIPRADLKKPWDDLLKFLRGVRYEYQKIAWPTRQELQYNAAVVIVVTVIISGYMWVVDFVLNHVFQWLHRG